MPHEKLARHQQLRMRAFRMQVKHTDLARRLLPGTEFSSVKSLSAYIGNILRGDATSAPMLDKVERTLDTIEAEREHHTTAA